MILGKLANEINHLITLNNKAPPLCSELYHVKAGSGVIYGNPWGPFCDGLQGDLPTFCWFIRYVFKGSVSKLVSPLHIVFSQNHSRHVFTTKAPQCARRFEQTPKTRNGFNSWRFFGVKSKITSRIFPLQWLVPRGWYTNHNLHSFSLRSFWGLRWQNWSRDLKRRKVWWGFTPLFIAENALSTKQAQNRTGIWFVSLKVLLLKWCLCALDWLSKDRKIAMWGKGRVSKLW